MTFTNQAALSYNGFTIGSNAVTGELRSPVSLQKTASQPVYTPDGALTYVVSVTNSAQTAFPGLTLTDDLGRYLWNGLPRFPMAYAENSVTLDFYSSAGVTPLPVSADADTDGMVFSFDLPAFGTALLSYGVYATPFAPPAAGSVVTNNATLNGNAPLLPLTAQHTLPIAENPKLTVTKCAPDSAVAGQPLRFAFIISNYGNTAVRSTDLVTLSDLFDPPLTGLSVFANGTAWREGVQYAYDERLYYFQTLPDAIFLPAATFTQDGFGRWNTAPSSATVSVTGTVAEAPPSQTLMEVLPAYADGREAFLSVQRLQNDEYVLGGTGAVPSVFSVLSADGSALSLIGTNPRFTLSGNLLTVSTDGLVGSSTASILVDSDPPFHISLRCTP